VLFDLSSPRRKTVVRIVYGTLAFLFLIGFIGFGIGGNIGGGGGILDALGLGGDDAGEQSVAEQYKQQIEDAEKRIAADPDNAGALNDLTYYRFLSGAAQIDQQTGEVTPEARSEFAAADEAWQDYLTADPPQPDPATAARMVQAYGALGDLEAAAEAQEIVVADRASAPAYLQLALIYYSDYNFKKGDEAGAKAVEEAPQQSKKNVQKQIDRIREAAEKQQKAQAKLPKSEEIPEPSLLPSTGTGLESQVPPATP
jgi:tetratricopeptide (TPR) repeat protein